MALPSQRHSLIAMVVAVAVIFGSTSGLQYWVGDAVWSIPPYPNFYNDWSSSHLFHVGDSLVFDFETEFYNLMQVTTLDYQNCKGDNPIKVLNAGPAIILLNEPGVFYYLCNLSYYCNLGQKISIVVQNKNFPPAPAPSPSPTPVLLPCSPVPFSAPSFSPEPSQADSNVPVASEAPEPTADLWHSDTCRITCNITERLGWLSAFCLLTSLLLFSGEFFW